MKGIPETVDQLAVFFYGISQWSKASIFSWSFCVIFQFYILSHVSAVLNCISLDSSCRWKVGDNEAGSYSDKSYLCFFTHRTLQLKAAATPAIKPHRKCNSGSKEPPGSCWEEIQGFAPYVVLLWYCRRIYCIYCTYRLPS